MCTVVVARIAELEVSRNSDDLARHKIANFIRLVYLSQRLKIVLVSSHNKNVQKYWHSVIILWHAHAQ